MKKSIITISAAIAFCCALIPSSASAQGLKIYLKNGAVSTIPYDQLDKVVPYEDETPAVNPGEHAYVDLGLSVKWAETNIGAETAADAGDYYMWASTVYDPNQSYTKLYVPYQDPLYADPDYFIDYFTKYCTSQDAGIPDNKKVLDPEDDAATVIWGEAWRMPTRAELEELINECTWTWLAATDEVNTYGVAGYKVTGPSGASIFLPACGYRYSTKNWYAGEELHYWTSSLDEGSCLYATSLEVSKYGTKQPKAYYVGRYMGESIRPVLKQ